MKFKILLLFMCAFTISINAQISDDQKPTYQGQISSVEYVAPISERPQDLIAPDNTPKEAKDKRSLVYESQIVEGKDPQVQDDYFVINRSEQEQTASLPPASVVFDAYSSNSQPTDPSLAIGPNHVFVVYNTGFAIYDKAGNTLVGQTAPNPAIFPSGGCCDLTVSYDNAADRWSNKVWALERDAMLNGDPNAQIVGFNLPGIVTSGFFSPQVLNVTDSNLPATGGTTIVYMQDDAWAGVSNDHIKLWTLDVDWNNTNNSTISNASEISVTPFIGVFDNGSFANLTQPGGGSAVDALQATIMNQAQFRKFAGHNSAIFNWVVDADASNGERAAVRWMELRQTADNQPWTLYQEGTYTAPDGRHAWNASLAMDAQGNIGMGYSSMSGPTTPSTVRIGSYFTGRSSGDPLGTMTGVEGTISAGNGNFSGTRYGDYSKIDVDPADDASFWFITEYINSGRKGVVGKFTVETGPPDTEAPTDPANLVATNVTDSGATLNWTASTDNVGVALYNIFIDGNQVGTSGTTSFNVSGLSASTTYSATVSAQDAAGNVSGTVATSFTTLAQSFCTSASSNVNDEFISRVQLNTIDNSSGAQFYSDFTAQSTSLSQGQAYTISVTPTWNGTVYNEGYAVWIDYNDDKDFEDAGELVWSAAPNQNTPNTGSFTVPTNTALASVRMRVSMKYNGIPSPCEAFTYGEVEDYTVNLAAGGDSQAPTTPTNLAASNITTSTATLNWNASTDNVGVTQYNLEIIGVTSTTSTTTSFNATGLAPSTTYTANVTAEDAAGNISGSATTTFTTADIVSSYCASASTNVNDEYISRVQLNTIDNTSGAQFYSDFTSQSTSLEEGQTYTISVTPTWTGTVYNEGYAVWIDYNNDQDFTDAGELVWSAAPNQTTPNSGSFTVPTGTSLASVRMRVSMKYNGVPTSCETFTYGEVEDYTVSLVESAGGDTQAPSTPLNLVVTNVAETTADLNWSASSDNVGVDGYEVYIDGSSIGTVSGTAANITGLVANTTYTFNVSAFDAAGNNSGLSNDAIATTTGGSGGGPGEIAGYYFETGLEGWIDGGSDCARVNDATRSFEGTYSVRLRDDSNSSNTVSPTLDLSGNTEVTIEWHTYSRSMEFGEDYFVEFWNGSSYEVIGNYARGTDFNNNSFFTDNIVLSSADYSFNANNRFRFRCDASGNGDYIYLDQVIITGDNVNSANGNQSSARANETNAVELKEFTQVTKDNIAIYPNPTTEVTSN